MAFEKILSVSGRSGLFMLVGQMKNGIIVESIGEGKRFPVYGTAKVSALEEISIYTDSEEVPLKEVLTKIYEKEKGKEALDASAGDDEVAAYFEEILPDYDRDRVYKSDMAKVVKWYNILVANDAFDPKEEEESEEEDSSEGEVKEAKKAAAKKKAAQKKAGAKPKGGSKATSKSKGSAANSRTTGSQRGK